VHTALQLAPVLAEKSKTPFYIAGGVLVVWALVVSMAIGMRRPSFPANLGQQRGLMAISAVLVVITVAMAVAVSGGEHKGTTAQAAPLNSQPTQTTKSEEQQGASTTPSEKVESQSENGSAPSPAATTGKPAPSSSPAAATKLSLAADPGGQLAYDAKTLTAKAGTVSIVMANMSPLEHNVTVAEGSKVLGATPTFIGGSRTLTLKLKPGTYTFYCSVPGHRQAGMEGKLTVTS
jgi:plastocyanin